MAETGIETKKRNLPANPTDYAGWNGAGYENQTSDDVAIPFLDVLQQTERRDDPRSETPPRGDRGDLFNTITRELKKETIIVPAITEHVFVEWAPREGGRGSGGPVGFHSPQAEVVTEAKQNSREFGKYTNANTGNDLVETFNIYALEIDEEDAVLGYLVLSFTSTKIKAYKALMTRLRPFVVVDDDGQKVRPPLFAHRVTVRGVKTENDKGKFGVFQLDPAYGSVADSVIEADSELLEEGNRLREMVAAGVARADFVTSGDAATTEDLPF